MSGSSDDDPSEHFSVEQAPGYEIDESINGPHPDESFDNSLEEDWKDAEIEYLQDLIKLYEEKNAIRGEMMDNVIEILKDNTDTVEKVIAKVCGMRLRKWYRHEKERAMRSIFKET